MSQMTATERIMLSEAQKRQAEAQLQLLEMQQAQARMGMAQSAAASQQQGLASLLGAGCGLAAMGLGGFGLAVHNPQLAGSVTENHDAPRRKPILATGQFETYENMYGGDFAPDYTDIPEAVWSMLTSDTSKYLLKLSAAFIVAYILVLAVVFGCSELYEYFSLLDV